MIAIKIIIIIKYNNNNNKFNKILKQLINKKII